ncbi:MAG: 5'-nucleotidase [Bdellovibrionales bacterium CG10_big_fil_rev_8_21_14_0_10_45_34]|nr:MAG: 5'-nucleotidase [Bdellovibrionales bacterium CG10_big_fil_rev_8_21_14_0_10_45_34]
MKPKVYVNRTLNLRRIQYIGFDMDHTLVRYNSEEFEKLSHSLIVKKLIETRNYPSALRQLSFAFDKVIRGLIIDRGRGNLIKVNRFGGIRECMHGLSRVEFAEQKRIYGTTYIDLSDPNFLAIDTAFSISLALLFAQIVDYKDKLKEKDSLPSYETISFDIEQCLDEVHRDNSLKDQVKSNLSQFVVCEPDVVRSLEIYKRSGKKLFVLTNSYFDYTKALLDFAITPFLSEHKSWTELFEIVIVGAQKPRFFWDKLNFFKVNLDDGTMTIFDDKLAPGVYHGGSASLFTKSLEVSAEDILYIGDHIYGDIVRLKKDCNWRTGLVVDELEGELVARRKASGLTKIINEKMKEKEPLEQKLVDLRDANAGSEDIQEVLKEISQIDAQISPLIVEYQQHFNPTWGEMMRIGNEESFFASQLERYACIYMPCLADLLACSSRTYFRGYRRILAHEVEDEPRSIVTEPKELVESE